MSTPLSLTDFAAQRGKAHTRCWLCRQDFVDEADAGVRAGVSIPVVWRWIRDCGFTISEDAIRNHYVAGHHND